MGGGGSESGSGGSGGKSEGVGGEGDKGEQASDDGEARVTLMPMTAAACKRRRSVVAWPCGGCAGAEPNLFG